MDRPKSFFLILLGAIFIFFSLNLFLWYEFSSLKNECVSSPLQYGAKQLSDSYGVEKVIGTVMIIPKDSIHLAPLIVTFNATDLDYKPQGYSFDFADNKTYNG